MLAVAALIVLRALVDELDFISFGWLLVLAALPLLPWLHPRLGKFLNAISPYLESLKLGALQLDLRAVRREAISVPSHGTADVWKGRVVPAELRTLLAQYASATLILASRRRLAHRIVSQPAPQREREGNIDGRSERKLCTSSPTPQTKESPAKGRYRGIGEPQW